MKIAIGVNHYDPSVGGAEIVVKTIAEFLAQYHEVFIFTRKLSKQKRDPRNFPFPIFEYRPGELPIVEKKVKSLGLDVFMIYSDVFDFFRPMAFQKHPFRLILALCGANWLYSQRNYIIKLYKSARNIQSIVLHSKKERDYKICSNNEETLSKVDIIPNGIWLDEFDNNTLTREDLAPDIADKQWLLNVSNFFPGKGQEHLAKILTSLPELSELAYVQISNDIDFPIGKVLEGRWKLAVRDLKDKGVTVQLKKNLEREKVIGFLKQSNVFVFPSEKEVAPLVLLEAMGASLPWVSTNVGNAEDLKGGNCLQVVKDSRFHSVFNNRVRSAFSLGIRTALNNPGLGEEGRQQIEDELNWNKILPKYRALLEGP